MNDFLENLNVIINYCYEYFNPNVEHYPKFSVLRMMITIWNREVLFKLKDNFENNLVVENLLKVYEKYLKKTINDFTCPTPEIVQKEKFIFPNCGYGLGNGGNGFSGKDIIVNLDSDSIFSISTHHSELQNLNNNSKLRWSIPFTSLNKEQNCNSNQSSIPQFSNLNNNLGFTSRDLSFNESFDSVNNFLEQYFYNKIE
jgi:hypothetical protein